jgi:hypothetical protein
MDERNDLEKTNVSSFSSSDGVRESDELSAPIENGPKKTTRRTKFKLPFRTIIIIALILALLSGVSITILAFQPATKKQATTKTIVINTQSLDNGTLNKIASQNGVASPSKQQLTIAPDTVFENNVNIQGSITVNKNLTVFGNTNLGGNLSVSGLVTAASLSVGSISINTINLSGDLNIHGHIVPSGSNPSITASVGASGGTATILGNDTAGTVTINTGNGTLIAGELAIITFRTPFATTPKVQLTPVTSTASTLRYYATRSATFFTIDTSTMPVAVTSYSFDYLVTQ